MWVGGGAGARKSKDCPVKMDEFPGEWTLVLTVHVVHGYRSLLLQFDISSFTYFSIFTQTFPRLGVICIDVGVVIILLNLIKTRS